MSEITVESGIGKRREGRLARIGRRVRKERQLWLLSLPVIIWVATFAYYPMYGIIIAFLKYIPGKPFLECEWVGLKYFEQFFTSPDIGMVLRNTLAISGLDMLFGFPAPIILAILLNEVAFSKFKRFAQTVSYMPYFVSWVVVANILFTLLSTDGMINKLLLDMGVIDTSISFLNTGPYFWWLITFSNIWKGIGWGSIIYLSAIAGIDAELYQAGAVDGLGRFGMIWHITLPGIKATILLLLILQIGGVLNAGFEQQLLIGNAQTRDYYEVIDTYVYKYGFQIGRYSYGAAIGFMRSLLALALVLTANKISSKVTKLSII
jgi:putative aldouronate transport system permease protein